MNTRHTSSVTLHPSVKEERFIIALEDLKTSHLNSNQNVSYSLLQFCHLISKFRVMNETRVISKNTETDLESIEHALMHVLRVRTHTFNYHCQLQ